MEAAIGGVIAAIATTAIARLRVAFVEVDRHDRQIAERDQDLEEWIIVRNRWLKQRLSELAQQANAAGVLRGGTVPAGRKAVQTELLYEYREERRQALNFVLALEVEERWAHRLARRLKHQPFPGLLVPDRAARLVDYWSEGTARNALGWGLDDINAELPDRATSRALAA